MNRFLALCSILALVGTFASTAYAGPPKADPGKRQCMSEPFNDGNCTKIFGVWMGRSAEIQLLPVALDVRTLHDGGVPKDPGVCSGNLTYKGHVSPAEFNAEKQAIATAYAQKGYLSDDVLDDLTRKFYFLQVARACPGDKWPFPDLSREEKLAEGNAALKLIEAQLKK